MGIDTSIIIAWLGIGFGIAAGILAIALNCRERRDKRLREQQTKQDIQRRLEQWRASGRKTRLTQTQVRPKGRLPQ